MFFRAEDYFRLRDRVAAAGCDVPIMPGIMPVTQIEHDRALRAAVRGAVPARGRRPGSTPSTTTRRPCAGSASSTPPSCAANCSTEGAPGIHFITFNKSTATREVYGLLDPASYGGSGSAPPMTA